MCMTERLFIQAITRQPRIEVTALAERAITDSGGWILDHHLFSNLAISLTFEIAAANVARLCDGLCATGLELTSESGAQLTALADGTRGSDATDKGDITGYLQITFVHDEPDLRRDVPAIAG